jgi:hypothetical protein
MLNVFVVAAKRNSNCTIERIFGGKKSEAFVQSTLNSYSIFTSVEISMMVVCLYQIKNYFIIFIKNSPIFVFLKLPRSYNRSCSGFLDFFPTCRTEIQSEYNFSFLFHRP